MRDTVPSDDPIMRDWQGRPGVVYFFKAGGFVKVGMAAVGKGETYKEAIVRRLKAIQSANHELLKLLGAILFTEGKLPAMNAEQREREIHNQFAELLRFRQHTVGAEWFAVSDELLAFIHENTKDADELGLPKHVATLSSSSSTSDASHS